MNEFSGFEVMDDALFILSHAIVRLTSMQELNIDLQLVIIELNKKAPSAADIVKKIKLLWTYEKDIENIFWTKCPLFNKMDIKNENLLLKITYQPIYLETLNDSTLECYKRSCSNLRFTLSTPSPCYSLPSTFCI